MIKAELRAHDRKNAYFYRVKEVTWVSLNGQEKFVTPGMKLRVVEERKDALLAFADYDMSCAGAGPMMHPFQQFEIQKSSTNWFI